MNFDPYETLGVAKDAGPEEIKRAYRQRAKSAHPDAGGSREGSWDPLCLAYAILTEPRRRQHYDRTGDVGKDNRIDDLTSNALGIVDSLFVSLVTEVITRGETVETVDMMFRVRETLRAQVDGHQKALREANKTLEEIAKMRKRFKFNGEGINRVEAILKDRERMCGVFIEGTEREIKARGRAREILDQYSYDWGEENAAELIQRIAGMTGYGAAKQAKSQWHGVDSLGRPF